MKDLTGLAKTLSDENRLKILRLLMEKDMCVCELMEVTGAPQARLSQHLLRLRNEGLVTDRRESQWVIYSLNKKEFRNRFETLRKFLFSQGGAAGFLDDELGRLGNLACRGTIKEKLHGGRG
ncbi:MAG TPA: metalloregulator ArsR/SmtB family transcription factor [bacterium]|nr:metalloregulator ArsR/SmtB family transcription factor [bacterium]